MVFGNAENHQHFGVVPIWLPKFPKSTAHGVDTSRGHIDRAKSTVGCVVWRTETLGPKRREAL